MELDVNDRLRSRIGFDPAGAGWWGSQRPLRTNSSEDDAVGEESSQEDVEKYVVEEDEAERKADGGAEEARYDPGKEEVAIKEEAERDEINNGVHRNCEDKTKAGNHTSTIKYIKQG